MGKRILIAGIILAIAGTAMYGLSSLFPSYAVWQLPSGVKIVFGSYVLVIGVILAGLSGIQMARSYSHNANLPNYVEGPTSSQRKIFCRFCGKVLPVAATSCPECNVKPYVSAGAGVKNCSYCTALTSGDSMFCADCGRKF